MTTSLESRGTSPRSLLERYLGDKLVKEGLLTAEQLAEVRAVQAERIVSMTAALTLLGFVDGPRLRRLCSRLLGTPSVNPGDVGRAEPEALALLSKDFVAEFRVIPFARRGETLFVATAEPWQLPVLAEVGARTGLRVASRFVEDAAIERLLEVLYGIKRRRPPVREESDSLGAEDMVLPNDLAPESRGTPAPPAGAQPRPEPPVAAPPAAEAPPARSDASAVSPGSAVESEELMSETTFAAIYQEAAWRSSGSALPPAGRQRGAQPGVARDLPPMPAESAQDAPPAPVVPAPVAAEAAPQRSPEPEPPQLGPEPAPPPAPAAPAEPAAPSASAESTRPAEDLGSALDEALGSADVQRALRPLTSLDEARTALAATGDSRQLGWLLTRYALSKGPRVALFTRRAALYVGWTAAGEGVDAAAVRELRLVPADGSVFAAVEATGTPFMGPLVEHPLHHDMVCAFVGF
jgi:hypothetical protein